MSISAAVHEAFEAHQVPFLARLVEAPSCSSERDDVEAAARIVDEVAASIGLTRAVHPGGEHADHRVFATPATAADSRAIALIGHVDTVFPRKLGFFGFTREGDVARGPGVLDMKGGLSVVLFALRALKASDPPAFAALRARFVCNTDEEVGSPSSAALFRALAPRTSVGLVFEAGRTEDRIVVARKGGGFFRITAEGRAAHSGNAHDQGINAIHALSVVVPRVEALTDYARGVTLSVGTIEGGTSKNTVPERASCGIDARFTRNEDARFIEDALRAITETRLEGRLGEAKLRLDGGITRPALTKLEGTDTLRLDYESAATRAGLGGGEAPLQGGGSDANLLSAAGVPCIDGLGPFGRGFHETSEWASLESLEKRTVALALYLQRAV